LERASQSDKRKIINLVKNHSHKTDKVREVIKFAVESGGVKYASEKMYEYRDAAIKILHTFPHNQARDSLEELVGFVTERRK